MNQNSQEIPVKLYSSDERVTVAAPMPGMEPENIKIQLSDNGKLRLEAENRGELKGEKDVIMDEWSPGPYNRELNLDTAVDGPSANATYNNGVLVVSLPRSDSFRSATIQLERISATEGRQAGNAGHSG